MVRVAVGVVEKVRLAVKDDVWWQLTNSASTTMKEICLS